MTSGGTKSDIRGRVILRMESGEASSVVLEIAVRVARTFDGELHGLFLRDENLLALAGLPFAREIFFSGRRSRALSAEAVYREMETAAETMRRRLDRLAQAARLPFRFDVAGRTAGGLPAELRSLSGILALGDPLFPATPADLARIFDEMSAIAGILLVGRDARRTHGPILLLADPRSDIAGLVDTAERIAGESGERLVVALSDAADVESRRMVAEVKQALGDGRGCEFVHAGLITPSGLARLARHYRPGLVVARAGLMTRSTDAVRYASAAECPILLLR